MIDPKYTTPQTFVAMQDDDPANRFQESLSSSMNTKPEDSHLYDSTSDVQSIDVTEEKDLTADNIPVNVITLHSLFLRCFPLTARLATSPEDALESLKSIKYPTEKFGFVPLFTDFLDAEKKNKSIYSQLWVHIPQRFSPIKEEFYLNFRIDRAPFYSQYLPDSTSAETFNYLSVYEDEESKPFIYLRLGNNGEILWLSKGDKLRGGAVKKLCLNMLSKIPLIPTSYLFDTATISLRVKGRSSQKVEKVFLSMILSLSSENGESWYGRSGFSPVKCKKLEIKGDTVSQDPPLYYQAVEKLRGIRFQTLKNLFARYHIRLRFLSSCIKAGTNPTLHEIFKTVHGQTRHYPNDSAEAVIAETKLFQLYDFFLNSKTLRTPTSFKAMSLYYLALETLKCHTIWQRGFMKDSVSSSYARFLQFPHNPFDETMDLVASKRPLKWQLPD